MTDIVERLQERATNGDGWTRPVAAEAADEIERLRAGLRQIASGNTCMALTTHPPICARAHTARALLKEERDD